MSAAACKKVLCCNVNESASAATGETLDAFFDSGALAQIEENPDALAKLYAALAEVDKATARHRKAQQYLGDLASLL